MARKKVKNIYLKSERFRKDYAETLAHERPCEEMLSAYVEFICWVLDEIDSHNNGFRTYLIKGRYNEYQDDEYLNLE